MLSFFLSLARSAGFYALVLIVTSFGSAQQAGPTKPKAPAPAATIHFADVTRTAKIAFEHAVSPEKKYLIESMSGGVLLLDYDQDGWLDIFFTNAQSISMVHENQKAPSALYHNNHDGTFSDVSSKTGIGAPCSAMGGAVADYNNDGWPDI